MKKYPSEEIPKFQLRLPHDLKRFIEEQAKKNGASQNSEIVRAVRERLERVQADSQAQKQ